MDPCASREYAGKGIWDAFLSSTHYSILLKIWQGFYESFLTEAGLSQAAQGAMPQAGQIEDALQNLTCQKPVQIALDAHMGHGQ